MPEGPDPLHQPLPLHRSILWKPATGSAAITDPIFVTQTAVAALREHAGTAPEQSLLGFLVGDLCESPDAEARFIVIGTTIRATQPVQGDRTTVVLNALWDRVRAEVKKSGGRLLGWYHTHPGSGPGIELSSYDVETHERYFKDAWQVALVIGAIDGQPAAGFFRVGDDESWASACLPFYEVLKEDSAGEGAKKRSYVVWKNYRAYTATARGGRASGSFPAPPPPAEPPEPPEREAEPEPEDPHELRFLSAAEDAPPPPRAPPRSPGPPPLPPLPPSPPLRPSMPGLIGESAFASGETEPAAQVRRSQAVPRLKSEEVSRRRAPPRTRATPRARRGRWRRIALALMAGLLLAAGGWGYWRGYWQGYWRFASQLLPRRAGPAPQPRAALPRHAIPAPPSPVVARLDRLADSLDQAVRNYDDRARLFSKRQLDCFGLSRGLTAVERAGAAYRAGRQNVRTALDAGRATRDAALRASVDSVQQRFRRSKC